MSQISVDAITDASGGTTASINGYTPSGSNMVGRNRIINGAMMIDQRNAGASVTPTGGSYTLDRWQAAGLSQPSKLTAQQSTVAPAGFLNSLLITSTSAYSVGSSESFSFGQRIEGYNVSDLNWGTSDAKTVTLSFWVRSSLTGTFGGSLANSAQDRSYPFDYVINAANTWEKKTITIAGDTTGTWLTNNGIGIRLYIGLGAGSTYSGTAGAWSGSLFTTATGATSVVGTNAATFYITGVQLEVGSTASEFEHRLYPQELALCQRYYENNYPTGTAVGTVMGDSFDYGLTYRSGTNAAYFGMIMQQRKRATPTLTAYNGVTGASGTWRGSSSANETITMYGNEVSFSASQTVTDSLIRSGFYTASAEL